MNNDNKYIADLEKAKGPSDPTHQKELEKEMGFKYRAATGELIFAMVSCRVDISFSVIKLTQFNNNPACCHYESVIAVYRFLQATDERGLIFWRPKPI